MRIIDNCSGLVGNLCSPSVFRRVLSVHCLFLFAGLSAFCNSARADSLVLSPTGPNYSTAGYNLISGSLSDMFDIEGTPVQGIPLFTGGIGGNFPVSSFTYGSPVSEPVVGTLPNTSPTDSPITSISSPGAMFNPGTIELYVDSTSMTGYLVEQVDTTYTTTGETSPNMQSLFISTDLLGYEYYSSANGGTYAFNFMETTATPFAPVGTIIGGYIEGGYDVKAFAVVPTPPVALGVLALTGCLAAWKLGVGSAARDQ
jgi:hypothetical protein